MNGDILFFFDKRPRALGLFELLAEDAMALWPQSAMKMQKTQITFLTRGLSVRLPAAQPRRVLMVSFGLSEPLVSPRLFAVANPAPGRYTHHVQIAGPQELDGELWEWIARSHADMAARAARRRT